MARNSDSSVPATGTTGSAVTTQGCSGCSPRGVRRGAQSRSGCRRSTSETQLRDSGRRADARGFSSERGVPRRRGGHRCGAATNLSVKVKAQSAVEKIEVVRNGAYVYTHMGGGKQAEFDYRDSATPESGTYYYVRVWLEGRKPILRHADPVAKQASMRGVANRGAETNSAGSRTWRNRQVCVEFANLGEIGRVRTEGHNLRVVPARSWKASGSLLPVGRVRGSH